MTMLQILIFKNRPYDLILMSPKPSLFKNIKLYFNTNILSYNRMISSAIKTIYFSMTIY